MATTTKKKNAANVHELDLSSEESITEALWNIMAVKGEAFVVANVADALFTLAEMAKEDGKPHAEIEAMATKLHAVAEETALLQVSQ